MKVFDTKKVQKQRETEKTDEDELREFEKWLDSATDTAAPSINDLNKLWPTSSMSPSKTKKFVDSLRQATSTAP